MVMLVVGGIEYGMGNQFGMSQRENIVTNWGRVGV